MRYLLSSKKKVAVATFGRSDWGLLRNLLFEVEKHSELEPYLIAAGSHFLDKFGKSIVDISRDGFAVNAAIDCMSGSPEAQEIVQDMSRSLAVFGQVLSAVKPDILFLLGDRFETLTAASAALILGIPIAHINGGELTEGAFDDSIRHAITKMASLHFVANTEYEARVLQLGESSDRVHNVGHLALDSFKALDPMSRTELEQMVGITLLPQNFLVTLHPETSSTVSAEQLVASVLGALKHFPNASIVFTSPNPDPGHEVISSAIKKFVISRPNSVLVDSLGPRGYLSMMIHSSIVLGNSSSGVLEAPIIGIPSIDVGDRQKGRTLQNTIHRCSPEFESVQTAISEILEQPFDDMVPGSNLREGATVSAQIVAILMAKLNEGTLYRKVFVDLGQLGRD
jgi:GDP/UDP-N,N'-diacetylbacillosamine 2-epimerase (hydrolysing)